MNEELTRGRNGRTERILCGDECESVAHVLWGSPAYKKSREEFMVKLVVTLDDIERASFVLGCVRC